MMNKKKAQSPFKENPALPFIEDAADLLLKCSGYLDDRKAALQEDENHWDTYYAIDNDIINLYLEPELKSSYLELFGESQKSITTRTLAFLLGDFLFKSTVPLIPGQEQQLCRFLIIPPHDEELIRSLNAIHRKLISNILTVKTETFETISNIFAEFEIGNNDDFLLKALQHHVPELVELYNPYKGPKAALERFALLPDTVFQRIDTYLENGFVFPLLDSIYKEEDRKVSDTLIEQWEIELKKVAPRVKPGYAIRRDAEVLAIVEYVNSIIKDLKKQLVLITGTNYLFAAAETRKPFGDSEPSFAEKYLRHPQSFLAHPKFFMLKEADHSTGTSLDENAQFRLVDWLTLFFPSGLRSDIQIQASVGRKFLKAIKHNRFLRAFNFMNVFSKSNNFNKLLEGWKSQVSSAAGMQYTGGLNFAEERGAITLANKLLELKNTSQWSLEKFKELIIKESLSSISSLYSSTALWVGLWSNIDRKVTKAVPALRFDGDYQPVETYSNELIKIIIENTNKQIKKDTLENLHKLSQYVEAIDPSLYHSHLVHALAFAAKGHWHATLTLANTAMTICDNIEESERGVRMGREAAYLACIAARRSAKNLNGLNDAQKYLDSAIRRENEGWPEDIRFAAERLILETRRYYFRCFCQQEDVDNNLIVELINGLLEVNTLIVLDANELIKLWVKRQVYTHLFTLLIIASKIQNIYIDLIVSDIDILIIDFKTILDDTRSYNHKPEDDPYAHLIYYTSKLLWIKNGEEAENCSNKAKEILATLVPHMPYDSIRFSFLKDMITESPED